MIHLNILIQIMCLEILFHVFSLFCNYMVLLNNFKGNPKFESKSFQIIQTSLLHWVRLIFIQCNLFDKIIQTAQHHYITEWHYYPMLTNKTLLTLSHNFNTIIKWIIFNPCIFMKFENTNAYSHLLHKIFQAFFKRTTQIDNSAINKQRKQYDQTITFYDSLPFLK